jgi:hypothetical protein
VDGLDDIDGVAELGQWASLDEQTETRKEQYTVRKWQTTFVIHYFQEPDHDRNYKRDITGTVCTYKIDEGYGFVTTPDHRTERTRRRISFSLSPISMLWRWTQDGG